jgi:hypothetical protein
MTANPSHRATPRGSAEVRRLAEGFNAFADAHETLKEDVERRVREANARIEQERNRLAALMSELAQSVVMCNVEGRILLYNARAMQLLRKPLDGGAPAGRAHTLVGLGRSIFGIFDRNLIIHALETIHERLAQGARGAAANFVTTAPSGLLVRVQMAPVFGAAGDVAAAGEDVGSLRCHRGIGHRFEQAVGVPVPDTLDEQVEASGPAIDHPIEITVIRIVIILFVAPESELREKKGVDRPKRFFRRRSVINLIEQLTGETI